MNHYGNFENKFHDDMEFENKLYKELFKKVKEGITFLDINSDETVGGFISVNEAFIDIIGYNREELTKMTIEDVIPSEELYKLNNVIEELSKTDSLNVETIVKTKKGTSINVNLTCYIINTNKQKMMVCIGHINSEKQLSIALTESEERYKKLVELLPDAVHIKKKSEIVYSNEAGAKLYEFNDPSDIIGKNDNDFTHPDSIEKSHERGRKVCDEGQRVPLAEGKIITKNKKVLDVEVASTAIQYDGETAILSVIRDITERKKIEKSMRNMEEENKKLLTKALEAEKLKTQFFKNMSHEFKTPLNVISGTVQLLINKIKNDTSISSEDLQRYTSIMMLNSLRLLRLINNLIDISKIESGQLKLNFKNQNIVSVIEETTLSVIEYAKNKGITITFDTDVEEKYMACDTEKLQRIMLNLLSNAIKYNKRDGKVYVKVIDNNDKVMISVEDTGIGIPCNKRKEIFECFKQVDVSLTRQNEGSGIGLALVKSLVEKLGGRVWVSSNCNEGTKFFIELPVIINYNDETAIFDHVIDRSLKEMVSIEFSDIYD